MIIDKQDLITQLADRTGLDQEQIQEQLSQLVQRIQQAAKEGKAFEIRGFGKFDLEEGSLQFTPSDMLETEINNKYAGMKPIELIGAFKEPEGDAVPEVDEEEESVEDVWGFDDEELSEEEIPESEVEAEAKSESEKEPAAETGKDKALAEEEPIEVEAPSEADAAEGEQPVSEEPEEPITNAEVDSEAGPEEQEPEEEFDIFETGEDDTASSEESELEPIALQSEEKKSSKVAPRQSEEVDDPIGRFLMVAVIVLMLGVGGWLIYDYGVFSGGNTGTEAAQTGSIETPVQQSGENQQDLSQQSEPEAENTANNSEPSGQAQVTNQGEQQEESLPQEQSQPPYGLRGQINQNVDNGYTIVLHSLRSMRKAENNRSRLEEEGYRALINEAEVAGTMYYRVGVGQFQTVSAAQEAAEKLPEPYKNDHFIKRIK